MPAPDGSALSMELEALYHQHFAFVWRTLRRFGVPEAGLDDATQDVFIVVLRRFGAWEERASFRTWIYGVARKVAFRHRRTKSRHERKVAALERSEQPSALDEQVCDRQRLERVAAAIAGLHPSRRQVYVLTVLEEMRAPEIADALGCNLNTVYSRLRRARADLDAVLGEDASDQKGRRHARSR